MSYIQRSTINQGPRSFIIRGKKQAQDAGIKSLQIIGTSKPLETRNSSQKTKQAIEIVKKSGAQPTRNNKSIETKSTESSERLSSQQSTNARSTNPINESHLSHLSNSQSEFSLHEEILGIIARKNPELHEAILDKNTEAIHTLLAQENTRHQSIIKGPFGQTPVLYTDLNAYGSPLHIAQSIIKNLGNVIGNTHGSSTFAQASTAFLKESIGKVFSHFGTPPHKDYDILVRGSGFTGAFDAYLGYLNRHISQTLKLPIHEGAIAFSEYEHHSNSLPFQDWVPSKDMTQLPLNKKDGQLNISSVKGFLDKAANNKKPYIILSLSMQSNVTGVQTDIQAIQKTVQDFLKNHPQYKERLFVSLDLAAHIPHGNVHLDTLLKDQDKTIPLIDGLAFSPYKLDGGQGGSGVALVRKHITGDTPLTKGGGTVANVFHPSKEGTTYTKEDRFDLHNAGSPNVLGLVSTYLGLFFKELVPNEHIHTKEQDYTRHVLDTLNGFESADGLSRVRILGPKDAADRGNTFPIIVEFKDGASGNWYRVAPNLISTALESLFGIVTRAGCNCAGPYAHSLFNIEPSEAKHLDSYIKNPSNPNASLVRPGWSRATLSPFLNQDQVNYFIDSLQLLGNNLDSVLSLYKQSESGFEVKNPVDIPLDTKGIPARTTIRANGRLIHIKKWGTESGKELLTNRLKGVRDFLSQDHPPDDSIKEVIKDTYDDYRQTLAAAPKPLQRPVYARRKIVYTQKN